MACGKARLPGSKRGSILSISNFRLPPPHMQLLELWEKRPTKPGHSVP
jgi:hypothetical protein